MGKKGADSWGARKELPSGSITKSRQILYYDLMLKPLISEVKAICSALPLLSPRPGGTTVVSGLVAREEAQQVCGLL